MHETSTQRSVFKRRLAKKEGENTFGRSCSTVLQLHIARIARDRFFLLRIPPSSNFKVSNSFILFAQVNS